MTTTSNTASIAAAAGDFNLCKCGCAKIIGRKSTYAQGHDAKHVSLFVAAYRSSTDNLGADVESLAIKHLSPSLYAKFVRAITGKAKAPKATYVSLVGQVAWVKVGRWVKVGEVASVTVDGNGNETGKSEVCSVTYLDGKGVEHVAQVDGGGVVWGLGAPLA